MNSVSRTELLRDELQLTLADSAPVELIPFQTRIFRSLKDEWYATAVVFATVHITPREHRILLGVIVWFVVPEAEKKRRTVR